MDSQQPPRASSMFGASRRRGVAALALVGLLGLFDAARGEAQACNAGPDFCTDDPRIPAALAAKKQSLARQGYPTRLVNLLDIGVQCIARIERATSFSLIEVQGPSQNLSIAWSSDDEDIAKKHLLNHSAIRYWIVNGRHAFSCNGQPPFNQQGDFDATDDINTTAAIRCSLTGSQVVCSR